jgi:hypothetical protein
MATDRHISRKRDGNHINRNVVAAMPPERAPSNATIAGIYR